IAKKKKRAALIALFIGLFFISLGVYVTIYFSWFQVFNSNPADITKLFIIDYLLVTSGDFMGLPATYVACYLPGLISVAFGIKEYIKFDRMIPR
ncbi:MAG: hypothetical protein ACHQF2_03555, partial [Flavobacteriales bacterium]